MIVKDGQTDRISLKRAFKGFTIGLVTIEDGGAPVVQANIIDSSKIIVTLLNKLTNREAWSMPLVQLYAMLNRNDRDIYSIIGAGGNVSFVNTQWEQNMSLDLDTYDGVYEFKIEMKDSVKAGFKISSYATITPVWSDEYMDFEVIYDDYSLDSKNFDEELGSGIEEIVVINMKTNVLPLDATFVDCISRASYIATEQNEKFNSVELRVLTASFNEEQLLGSIGTLTIHDGEILSNCRCSVEMNTADQDYMLVYKKMLKNPNASVSKASSENKLDNALKNIQEA